MEIPEEQKALMPLTLAFEAALVNKDTQYLVDKK